MLYMKYEVPATRDSSSTYLEAERLGIIYHTVRQSYAAAVPALHNLLIRRFQIQLACSGCRRSWSLTAPFLGRLHRPILVARSLRWRSYLFCSTKPSTSSSRAAPAITDSAINMPCDEPDCSTVTCVSGCGAPSQNGFTSCPSQYTKRRDARNAGVAHLKF
jgi:hypothetical protein